MQRWPCFPTGTQGCAWSSQISLPAGTSLGNGLEHHISHFFSSRTVAMQSKRTAATPHRHPAGTLLLKLQPRQLHSGVLMSNKRDAGAVIDVGP